MKITDDIFKSIFNESVWISFTISLNFVPKGQIDYKSALLQVLAWHRIGEKPFPESMRQRLSIAPIVVHCQCMAKHLRFQCNVYIIFTMESVCWQCGYIYAKIKVEPWTLLCRSPPILIVHRSATWWVKHCIWTSHTQWVLMQRFQG